MKYLDNLDCLGRSAVRPEHAQGVDLRGDPALHPVLGRDPRAEADHHFPAGHRARPHLQRTCSPASEGRERRVRQRQGHAGERLSVRRLRNGVELKQAGGPRDRSDHDLLLHAAEFDPARILRQGGGPALQDPPLHEHPGPGGAAAAVRAADQPGSADRRGGSRCGSEQRAQRDRRSGAALSVQLSDAKGAGAVRRGAQPRRGAACRAGEIRRRRPQPAARATGGVGAQGRARREAAADHRSRGQLRGAAGNRAGDHRPAELLSGPRERRAELLRDRAARCDDAGRGVETGRPGRRHVVCRARRHSAGQRRHQRRIRVAVGHRELRRTTDLDAPPPRSGARSARLPISHPSSPRCRA